jgi:hypothetical protein
LDSVLQITNHQAKRRKNPQRLEPEEDEGMPQHEHCPPAKNHEDKTPKYLEERQKDVARVLAAHPLQTVGMGHNNVYLRVEGVTCDPSSSVCPTICRHTRKADNTFIQEYVAPPG